MEHGVLCWGFRVQGSFTVYGLGLRGSGLGFRLCNGVLVLCLGFRVSRKIVLRLGFMVLSSAASVVCLHSIHCSCHALVTYACSQQKCKPKKVVLYLKPYTINT